MGCLRCTIPIDGGDVYELDEGIIHLECLTRDEAIAEIRQQGRERVPHPWAEDEPESSVIGWLPVLSFGFGVAGTILGTVGLFLR